MPRIEYASKEKDLCRYNDCYDTICARDAGKILSFDVEHPPYSEGLIVAPGLGQAGFAHYHCDRCGEILGDLDD